MESTYKTELPDPKQVWAHSTCSKEELLAALNDPSITAIEADIVMGNVLNESKDKCDLLQPIMAHPPDFFSDLTFDNFMVLATQENDGISYKHLKLDFKQFETLEPVLNSLHEIMSRKNISFDKTIFLNADILRGPGKRYTPLNIEADPFIRKCLEFTGKNSDKSVRYALSLGWSVDCRSIFGYSISDVDHMIKVIERNNVLTHVSVVIAVNARVLAKDPSPFYPLLRDYPQIQLLAWTGTGEPPISNYLLDTIMGYFVKMGCSHQIGFDCKVASSVAMGMFYDNIVRVVGLFWNMKQLII